MTCQVFGIHKKKPKKAVQRVFEKGLSEVGDCKIGSEVTPLVGIRFGLAKFDRDLISFRPRVISLNGHIFSTDLENRLTNLKVSNLFGFSLKSLVYSI
jgi:hypothetical protein